MPRAGDARLPAPAVLALGWGLRSESPEPSGFFCDMAE
jgi:hypothetical protein